MKIADGFSVAHDALINKTSSVIKRLENDQRGN